jgi:hypothetical protein
LALDEVQRDCGCTFSVPSPQLPEGQAVLVWSYASTGRARIDGRLLEFSSPEEVYRPLRKGKTTIGDKMSFVIAMGPYRISGRCTASEVCKPKDNTCEWTSYQAHLELSGPKGVSHFSARGVCGC